MVHRAGVKQESADALSWLSTWGTNQTPLEHDFPVAFISNTDDTKRECPTNVLEGFTNTIMSVKSEPTRINTSTLAGLNKAWSEDVLCEQAVKQVECSGTELYLSKDGEIIRCAPIPEAVQKWVPQLMRQPLLYLTHYPALDGHSEQRRMHETMRMDQYRPNMPMTCTTLWATVTAVQEMGRCWNPNAIVKYFLHQDNWNLLRWTP